MKPTKYTESEKEYQKLTRERSDVQQEILSLGYTTLEKPVRHGWYYEMILDPVLSENPKYAEAYDFLQQQGTYIWGKDKSTSKSFFLSRSEGANVENYFLLTTQKEFNRFSDKMHPLCVLHVYYITSIGKKNKDHKVTSFRLKIPANYIKFKFTRAYITHRRIIDPALESKYQRLTNTLFSKHYNRYHKNSSFKDIREDFKLDRKKSKSQLKELMYKN